MRHSSYLAVVPSEVEVHSLWGGTVPSAMAGCERNPDNSSTIARCEPALLVIAFSAYRLLLLALGYPSFPGQTQDVGVAAENRAMFYGCEHPCVSLCLLQITNYVMVEGVLQKG